jgi:hypothetical protein
MMGGTVWKCLYKRINLSYCIRLCNSWNYVSIVYFYILSSVCVCVLTGLCLIVFIKLWGCYIFDAQRLTGIDEIKWHVYVCVCVCVCVCMYVFYFIYIYIYIYLHSMLHYNVVILHASYFFYVVYISLVLCHSVYLICFTCPYTLFNTILSVKSLKCL